MSYAISPTPRAGQPSAWPLRHLGVVIAIWLLAGSSMAAAAPSMSGRLVALPGGRHLYLNCLGNGKPTVVLEPGFAATSDAWFKVQPALARKTRVCSYDRAGYGRSEIGPFPRDGLAVAHDLDRTLKTAGLKGPYVLVGHSAGALYVRLFRDLHIDDVVGMVFVDPSVEHQDFRFALRFGTTGDGLAPLRARAERCLDAIQKGLLPSRDPSLSACSTDGTKYQSGLTAELGHWRTEVSELDTLWKATSDEVDDGAASFGTIPVAVLTANGTFSGAPSAVQGTLLNFWRQLHRELAAKSTRGHETLVPNTSHLMMLDRPDAIIQAVTAIVLEYRSRHADAR